MLIKQSGGKLSLATENKEKIYKVLQEANILPVNQGEVSISISPENKIGNIKVVSHV